MFRVEITTDSAAFEDVPAVDEITSCLNRVIQRIQREGLRTDHEAGAIIDTHGNTVGKWVYHR